MAVNRCCRNSIHGERIEKRVNAAGDHGEVTRSERACRVVELHDDRASQRERCFHRVIVHGSTFPLEWLKLTVTPGGHAPATSTSFGPFSWERMPVS